MGDTLFASILSEKPTIQQEAYWWPLIFEAMHRAAFQFHHVGSMTQKGSYFSFLQEMDEIQCTFQALWDVIHGRQDQILVLFWPSHVDIEPFHIDVTVQKQKKASWQIDITIENGYLTTKHVEQQISRVKAFLRASFALYELCYPCNIRLFWDEVPGDLLLVRASAQDKPLEPAKFYNQTLQWKEISCSGQQHIYLVDPLPISCRGKPIPLHSPWGWASG